MLEAIVFGLIHGITAFLPLSTLAHRTVISVFLGLEPPGLAMEAGLELGAFLAAGLFFGLDWLQMVANAMGLRLGRDPELRRVPGALWMLSAASAPLALAGYWLQSAEIAFRNPYLVGPLLIGVGVVMGSAEMSARRQKTVDHLTFADAMLIGLVQTLTVLPGASRMAVTLTAAMLLNFDRVAAVRLSYLLALPVLGGRVLFTLRRLAESGGLGDNGTVSFVAGALTCALAGCATIAFFSEYIRQGTLRPFVRYRVVFGIIVIALALLLR
jgi:undecaprenyl-diphosphatase